MIRSAGRTLPNAEWLRWIVAMSSPAIPSQYNEFRFLPASRLLVSASKVIPRCVLLPVGDFQSPRIRSMVFLFQCYVDISMLCIQSQVGIEDVIWVFFVKSAKKPKLDFYSCLI